MIDSLHGWFLGILIDKVRMPSKYVWSWVFYVIMVMAKLEVESSDGC